MVADGWSRATFSLNVMGGGSMGRDGRQGVVRGCSRPDAPPSCPGERRRSSGEGACHDRSGGHAPHCCTSRGGRDSAHGGSGGHLLFRLRRSRVLPAGPGASRSGAGRGDAGPPALRVAPPAPAADQSRVRSLEKPLPCRSKGRRGLRTGGIDSRPDAVEPQGARVVVARAREGLLRSGAFRTVPGVLRKEGGHRPHRRADRARGKGGAGLPPRARAVLDVDRYAAEVEEMREAALRSGVRGPPTVEAGGRRLEGLPGRQELLRLLRATAC